MCLQLRRSLLALIITTITIITTARKRRLPRSLVRPAGQAVGAVARLGTRVTPGSAPQDRNRVRIRRMRKILAAVLLSAVLTGSAFAANPFHHHQKNLTIAITPQNTNTKRPKSTCTSHTPTTATNTTPMLSFAVTRSVLEPCPFFTVSGSGACTFHVRFLP